MAKPIADLTGKYFGELLVLGQDLERTKVRGRTFWKCKCSCGQEKSVRSDALKKARTCGECLLDLTKREFGQLTVQSLAGVDKYGHRIWSCKCNCGNIVQVLATNLLEGRTKSCGCLHSAKAHETTFKDLKGIKFGFLTPESYTIKHGKTTWYCRCECGNYTKVSRANLTSNHTTSCGCLSGSIGEENIARLLRENNVTFEREKVFADLTDRRFDFYIPSINRIIEFDGSQHFKSCSWFKDEADFEAAKARDQQKNNYCFINGIDLVRIPYTERDTLTLDLILGDKYLLKGSPISTEM